MVNRALLELAARRIRFLAVFMPPRHGKSMLISQFFPGWWLGTFPDDRVILTSYEAGFAGTWGRKARDALDEYGPEVFGMRVNPESSSVSAWDVQRRVGGHWRATAGGMVTSGVGGPITGRGANLFIIDDPVKNAEEARSKTYQAKAWDWWRSTALTRLEPDGVMALMMTRWNQNDLAGRILAEVEDEEAQEWTVISLPALAEEGEALPGWHREPGEALWPARYPVDRLERIKKRIQGYWFNALYQQRPTPDEGTKFKRLWFRYFGEERMGDELFYVLHKPEGPHRVPAAGCWLFQTCDPAASAAEQADWFVLATWAVTPDRDLLLLDVFRERAETTLHEQIMRDQLYRWPEDHRPTFQGVEKAAYGLNIIQAAAKAGLPIKPMPAEGDKVARALTIMARYQLGTVYHRQGAAWLNEWEEELADFPNGEHDDQVDVAAYAGIELVQSGQFGVGYGID